MRRWAGQPENVGCACCGGAFYNADGNPVCCGCRENYPYQRELLRARLLVALSTRALDLAALRLGVVRPRPGEPVR